MTPIQAGSRQLQATGLLTSRLLQKLAKKSQASSLMNKGFTLVELMVVIVIVGILSAIALPNFLKQTDKAKATEAKQNIASTLKQAQAQYVEDGTAPKTAAADMNELYGTPLNGATTFNYAAAWSSPIYTITATGNATDAGLTSKVMKGCVNFDTGKVDVQSVLDQTAAPSCS